MKYNKIVRMMIKSIFIFFIIFLSFNTIKSNAKYSFEINEEIINLTRDTRIANYVINYSTIDLTNQNVTVTIIFDKAIETLNGFEKVDDYTFRKTYAQNINENAIFKDYSGNIGSLNIIIRNIDKVMPQINGLTSSLKAPLNLTYTDNVGVQSVEVEKYSTYFAFEVLDGYYDTATKGGMDILNTLIKVRITNKPIGTKKFKYYVNGVLQVVSIKPSYIFKNLTANTNNVIKIQAIDENGNVLGELSKTVKTFCFDSMNGWKTSDYAAFNFGNIDSKVTRVDVAIWNDGSPKNVLYYNTKYDASTKNLTYYFYLNSFPYRNDNYVYKLHFYFKDSNGNTLAIVPTNVQIGVTAPEEESIIVENINKITSAGNYKITVIDMAGNKLEKYITVS